MFSFRQKFFSLQKEAFGETFQQYRASQKNFPSEFWAFWANLGILGNSGIGILI